MHSLCESSVTRPASAQSCVSCTAASPRFQ
ncbi:Uncharacterised protein [Bordetella pertussis]|nr:Uncharacterised protein [Bordetella pertussis]